MTEYYSVTQKQILMEIICFQQNWINVEHEWKYLTNTSHLRFAWAQSNYFLR